MKLPRPLAFRAILLEFFLLFFSFQASVSITTPEDPDKLLRTAYEHQRAGNFALAKGLCRRILTEFPHYVDARNLYARMLAFETNYVDALSQYDSALVFSERNEDARFGKAQVFGWMGRFKNATEILQPLTEEQAGNALYATELAKVLSWSGEHLRAYREYERAFIFDSKSEEVLRGAARSAKSLHRKEEALDWYQRVLAVVPFDREAQSEINRLSFSAANELQLQTSYEAFESSSQSHQLFAADYYRELSDRWKSYVHFSSISKFGITESNFGAGCYGVLSYGASIFAQLFVSPGANVIPRFDATSELSVVLFKQVEGIMGYRFFSFANTQVLLFTPGTTVYVNESLWITPRLYLSQASDGSSSTTYHTTLFFRLVPSTLIRLAFFSGNESFRATSIDQVISVRSDGVVAGVRMRVMENLGLELLYQFTSRAASAGSHFGAGTLSLYF